MFKIGRLHNLEAESRVFKEETYTTYKMIVELAEKNHVEVELMLGQHEYLSTMARMGDIVKFDYDIYGRNYKDKNGVMKNFTTVKCINLELVKNADSIPSNSNPAVIAPEKDDDLPF